MGESTAFSSICIPLSDMLDKVKMLLLYLQTLNITLKSSEDNDRAIHVCNVTIKLFRFVCFALVHIMHQQSWWKCVYFSFLPDSWLHEACLGRKHLLQCLKNPGTNNLWAIRWWDLLVSGTSEMNVHTAVTEELMFFNCHQMSAIFLYLLKI